MNEQKRFKKQKVSNNTDKRMEQGAKALKGALGLVGAVALFIRNKDNLKTLAKNIGNLTKAFRL